jgi:Mg2+ and Co2+ transporter CorA
LHQQKQALLAKYHQLTLGLLAEGAGEQITQLLAERQQCIETINELDHCHGSILMNGDIQEMLRQIKPLEQQLMEKLAKEKQKALSALQALKKEKTIKQQYGEPAFTSSGVFFDKRK